jgi:serine/threonine protein kinase
MLHLVFGLVMVASVTKNKDQAHWILSQGLLKQDILEKTLADPHQKVGADLCEALLKQGLLTEAQVLEIREKTTRPKTSQRQNPPISTVDSRQDRGPPAAAHQLPPSLASRYEVVRELGRGAMGVIYQAIEQETGQSVALKFMLNGHPDESEVKRFQREAETLIRLKHPNIIDIFDFGIEEGHPYFAMEFIQGQSLLSVLEETVQEELMVPDWSFTVQILIEVAGALDYCHERDIYHRDVKPQNILLEEDSARVLLLDFGLMKREGDASDSNSSVGLTHSGEMVGTPAFMSPEQFAPGIQHGEIGPHSDVWGFGATLFYGLTGLPPYNEATLVDIYQAIKKRPTPNPQDLNTEVPDWLADLCQSCLNSDSSQRPPIAQVREQMLEGLKQNQQAEPGFLIPILASVLLSLIIGGGLGLLLQRDPLSIQSFEAQSILTSKSSMLLIGQINRGSGTVFVNGKSVKVNSNGSFQTTLPLKEGENLFQTTLPGLSKRTEVSFQKVVKDSTAPRVHIYNIQEPSNDFYFLEEDGWLKGRLADKHPQSVQIDGKIYPTDQNGEFKFRVPDADLSVIALKIQGDDRLGQSTNRTIKVFSRAKYNEQQQLAEQMKRTAAMIQMPNEHKVLDKKADPWKQVVFDKFFADIDVDDEDKDALRPLLELNSWQSSGEKAQDQAIAIIKELMEDDYRFVGTRRYGQGAAQSRIAAFEHKSTGLILQLIPGSIRWQRWWPDPRIEVQIRYLGAIADKSSKLTFFKSILENLSNAIRERLCKKFGVPNRAQKYLDSVSDEKADWQKVVALKKEDNVEILHYFKSNPEEFQRLKADCQNTYDWIPYKSQSTAEYIMPFLLGRSEVSQGLWQRFARRSKIPKLDYGRAKDLPVYGLDYESIEDWLSEREGELRLPSEREWFYSCQASASSLYFWRDQEGAGENFSWFKDNSEGRVHSSKELQDRCNSFGLVDMLGNVAEWCKPLWDLWWLRWAWLVQNRNAEISLVTWDHLEYLAPILGGSIRWNRFQLQRQPCYYDFIQEHEGIWGFRVAASIR